MPKRNNIYKNNQKIHKKIEGTDRILRPDEYKKFLQCIKNPIKKFSVETAFMSGLRLQELVDFSYNVKWFNPEYPAIILPSSYTKTNTSRTVHITPFFAGRLEIFLLTNKLKYPTRIVKKRMIPDYASWSQWYKRIATKANIENPNEIKAKISRKSFESWLIASDKPLIKVVMSQGHSDIVSIRHYLNLAFTPDQREAAKKLTESWME